MAKVKAKGMENAEQQRIFSGLLWVAEHFNIKPNWAWAAYKQRSGAYPPGLVNVPIMPDVSLIRWALEGRLGWCEANEATYSAKHCRECLTWLDQQSVDAIGYESERAWQAWLAEELAKIPKATGDEAHHKQPSTGTKTVPVPTRAELGISKQQSARGANVIVLANFRKVRKAG
jgi:hypothetical protein